MRSLKVAKEYTKRRAQGWRAANALHAAKTLEAWDAAGGHVCEGDRCMDCDEAEVRLRVVWDDCSQLDDLLGDCFNPRVNPDIQPSRLEREREQEIARIEREGVVGIVTEYWTVSGWEQADSCYGFVGNDWRASGYDIDAMSVALRARALEPV